MELGNSPMTWPGDPLNTVNGGTTVSGGNTVLSSILQQSFRMLDLDWKTKTAYIIYHIATS